MDPRLPVQHHPLLYFPDGDVILSAQTAIPFHGLCYTEPQYASPIVLLFRVHKAILGHHSPAFKNMFLDATASAEDTYDGASVVPMIGDRAEDLAQLLTYLYDPSASGIHRLDPDKPRRLSGMIRLMDKYLLERQHKYLIDQVVSDWPTTLRDWDLRQSELDVLDTRHGSTLKASHPNRTDPHIPDPAAAIAFAREFGCPEILPAAFYQLSTTSAENLLHPNAVQTAEWGLLSKEDMLRYTQGCQRLWNSKLTPGELLGDECLDKCKKYIHSSDSDGTFPECLRHVKTFMKRVPQPDHYGVKVPKDSLGFLSDMMKRWNEEPQEGMCADCSWEIIDKLSNIRNKIWDDLSQTFVLDI